MIKDLSTGVWWIDLLAVFGLGFVAFLLLVFPAWMVADRLRWRKADAAELARLSSKKPAKAVEAVTE